MNKIQLDTRLTILIFSLFIILLFLLFEYTITNGHINVPLDDVYIHFQFSKNISEGNGFSFIANNPTPGSTSPLWTIFITIPYLFLKNHILISKLLSAIFYSLCGILMYILCNHFYKNKSIAFISAITLLMYGRFAWSALCGMEATAFTFFLLLFLILNLKHKSIYLQSIILGVSSLLRPEGYLIFSFFLLSEITALFKKHAKYNVFKKIIISFFVYILIILPYLVFSYKTTGSFLPNTFTAQSISAYPVIFRIKLACLYILRYSYLLLIDNPIIAIGLPFGLYIIIKQIKQKRFNFILPLMAVGFPVIESIIAPNLRHHGR